MANFDREFFGLVFPGFQATQKIHAQNARPELSAFLSNFTFLNPKFIHGNFLLTGETKNSGLVPGNRDPKARLHHYIAQVNALTDFAETQASSRETRKLMATTGCKETRLVRVSVWTYFYTPPVLEGAALFDNSVAAVYKNPVP